MDDTSGKSNIPDDIKALEQGIVELLKATEKEERFILKFEGEPKPKKPKFNFLYRDISPQLYARQSFFLYVQTAIAEGLTSGSKPLVIQRLSLHPSPDYSNIDHQEPYSIGSIVFRKIEDPTHSEDITTGKLAVRKDCLTSVVRKLRDCLATLEKTPTSNLAQWEREVDGEVPVAVSGMEYFHNLLDGKKAPFVYRTGTPESTELMIRLTE